MIPLIHPISQFDCMDYSEIPAGDFHCPSHLHHFHQLDIILEGRVCISLDTIQQLEANGGTCLLIPPLCRHAYYSEVGFRQISFKFHLHPHYWAIFGNEPRATQLPKYRLEELEHCGLHFAQQTRLAQLQANGIASLCLASIAETVTAVHSCNEQEQLPVIWRLLETIEAQPYAPWSVAQMAKTCHLSPDHFSRSFHALLIVTPQRYLIEARMRAAAAELINDRKQPIKRIAETAGYANVHSFSRAFKAVFNSSPAAYRQARSRF
jgi:AraC-like DNA-binding protein